VPSGGGSVGKFNDWFCNCRAGAAGRTCLLALPDCRLQHSERCLVIISNPLAKIVATKGWCVADGATGTNLFGRGLETGYPPELWSLERPDDILWLHNNFIDAGSDLILTNSFGGTTFRLRLHNAQDRVAELN